MSSVDLPVLDILTPILVTGADSRAFLQGQLSNDLALLEGGISQLTSCNSPQGRVQAVLTLVPRPSGITIMVHQSLAASLRSRLGKYVLRSKVSLTDPGDLVRVGMAGRRELGELGLPCPDLPGQYLEQGGIGVLRWLEPGPGVVERFLVFGDAAMIVDRDPATVGAKWRLADIRAGVPVVLPGTQEVFVAQMLNLDLLGGISFEKGCYTGQEIIARTRYRGAIKRRMFRFGASCSPPVAGTRVLHDGNHAGDVVDAVATDQGCELLAVVNLAQRDKTLELATAAGLRLERLPLPYDAGA